jgi:hypothetical protein
MEWGVILTASSCSKVDNNQLNWLPAELGQLPKLKFLNVRHLGPLDLVPESSSFLQLHGNPLPTIAGLPFEEDNAEECALHIDEILTVMTHIGTIRARATEICVALQDLELPAFVTLQIIDEAVHENSIRMWAKWELITAVLDAAR